MIPKILVIISSVREGRKADQVVQWFRTVADSRTDLSFEYADLKTIPLPLYAQPGLPSVIEHEYTDPAMAGWVKTIESADGFIIVTPEYNHSFPASLKNALDYVYAGWNRKPVSFVAYGGASGGIRAIEQLKLVALDLQLHPIRAEVTIPFISRAFGENGQLTDEAAPKRLAAMLDQLAWWAAILKDGRDRTPFPSQRK